VKSSPYDLGGRYPLFGTASALSLSILRRIFACSSIGEIACSPVSHRIVMFVPSRASTSNTPLRFS